MLSYLELFQVLTSFNIDFFCLWNVHVILIGVGGMPLWQVKVLLPQLHGIVAHALCPPQHIILDPFVHLHESLTLSIQRTNVWVCAWHWACTHLPYTFFGRLSWARQLHTNSQSRSTTACKSWLAPGNRVSAGMRNWVRPPQSWRLRYSLRSLGWH